MREIEFRVYTERNNGMEYFEDLEQFCNVFDAGFLYNEKVMQYTGLKDKNGVKIFEGDIVVGKFATGEVQFGEFSVTSDGYHGNNIIGFYYGYEEELNSASKVEVIGNIYQNKELLKNETIRF